MFEPSTDGVAARADSPQHADRANALHVRSFFIDSRFVEVHRLPWDSWQARCDGGPGTSGGDFAATRMRTAASSVSAHVRRPERAEVPGFPANIDTSRIDDNVVHERHICRVHERQAHGERAARLTSRFTSSNYPALDRESHCRSPADCFASSRTPNSCR